MFPIQIFSKSRSTFTSTSTKITCITLQPKVFHKENFYRVKCHSCDPHCVLHWISERPTFAKIEIIFVFRHSNLTLFHNYQLDCIQQPSFNSMRWFCFLFLLQPSVILRLASESSQADKSKSASNQKFRVFGTYSLAKLSASLHPSRKQSILLPVESFQFQLLLFLLPLRYERKFYTIAFS